MRKTFRIVSLLLLVCFIGVSCNDKTKSYSDKLKNEKKIINSIIDEKDFKRTKNLKEAFNKDTFYEMANGVLINIVDSGNGTKFKDGETVNFRVKVTLYTEPGVVFSEVDGTRNGYDPLEYRYNSAEVLNYLETSSYIQSPSLLARNALSDFFCAGVVSTLNYLTDKSKVRLIVPFSMSSDALYKSGYFTVLYDEVKIEVYR